MLKHKPGRNLVLALVTLALGMVLLPAGTARAADTMQAVAESYGVSQPLQEGIIVRLDSKDKSKVVAASYNSINKIFGVTVSASATPVSLSSGSSQQQAYVVTSGRYHVLVSNQNGAIAADDYISVSAIDGIGMKANEGQDTILGRATQAFNGQSSVISTTSLKLQGGKQMQASIGSILVDISVRANPKFKGSGGIPGFIDSFATGLAGKSVNATQVYGSMLILIMGLGVVAALIYSGIQTSMTAIGRNPLAKKSIIRNMLQIVIIAILVFIGCLIAVYLILKL
jgi:hypothetical protein